MYRQNAKLESTIVANINMEVEPNKKILFLRGLSTYLVVLT